jgi:nitroreductase
MEFSDLITKRYSVRAYKSIPIEETKLKNILEAARMAPTAANYQPFRFIVIHTSGRETELRRIYRRSWFVQAPIIICACGLPSQGWVRSDGMNYTYVDVAIAMDHLILAAVSVGLGTCWVADFDVTAACDILGLPEPVEPIAFTPLGYPDDQPKVKVRKSLSELVRYERW